MVVAVVLGAILVLCAVAALLGWTADTRDPAYSLGAVLQRRERSNPPTGALLGTLPSGQSPRSSVDRAAAF